MAELVMEFGADSEESILEARALIHAFAWHTQRQTTLLEAIYQSMTGKRMEE